MSRVRRPPAAECRGGAEVGPRRHAELHHHRRGRRGAPPLDRDAVRRLPRSAFAPALQQGHDHRRSDCRRRVSGRQDARSVQAGLSGQEGPDRRPVRAAPGRQLHPHRSRSRVRLVALRVSRVRASRGLERCARPAGVDERGARRVLQLVRAGERWTRRDVRPADRRAHSRAPHRGVDAGRNSRGDDARLAAVPTRTRVAACSMRSRGSSFTCCSSASPIACQHSWSTCARSPTVPRRTQRGTTTSTTTKSTRRCATIHSSTSMQGRRYTLSDQIVKQSGRGRAHHARGRRNDVRRAVAGAREARDGGAALRPCVEPRNGIAASADREDEGGRRNTESPMPHPPQRATGLPTT